MEGLFNIVGIIGVLIVLRACYSSSAESSLATKTAKTTLTTFRVRSTGIPKPNSWYNHRRINVEPIANFTSTPYDLLKITGSLRRNNIHFEWDYWCQTQPKTGRCSPSRASTKKYYYDAQTDTCKKFMYSGCDGNKNNFQTRIECERHCKGSYEMTLKDTKKTIYCNLQPNAGVCLGFSKRYYYDLEANDCKTFVYGGCGGNQNRFDSYDLCIKRCKV